MQAFFFNCLWRLYEILDVNGYKGTSLSSCKTEEEDRRCSREGHWEPMCGFTLKSVLFTNPWSLKCSFLCSNLAENTEAAADRTFREPRSKSWRQDRQYSALRESSGAMHSKKPFPRYGGSSSRHSAEYTGGGNNGHRNLLMMTAHRTNPKPQDPDGSIQCRLI